MQSGEESKHYVVGIGASAGGLEALEKLFHAMPTDLGLSFVVIQHLSPEFKSQMDQLLRRKTELQVRVVEDGMRVERDVIYLIPPNNEMVISNGKLLLTERSPERVLSHPIDQFFRSLAQDVGRYSLGVVLSGTGSDGSRGISEIANEGGLVIAQEPETARFDSMPNNAQETGDVHLVLPPEAIGEAIARYVREGDTPEDLREQQLGRLEETGLNRIFRQLQSVHAIDFSHYKTGTVERRIQRRIEMHGLPSVQDYDAFITEHPAELNELYKDLLIGVTRFFRDPDAFAYLKAHVLPEALTKCKNNGELFRAWVCGCATGEEAYSLAILIQETIDELQLDLEFKMFATDAHRGSLQFAANGVYPDASLDDISESRKNKYFRLNRGKYSVSAGLRRRVVFAPHNVIDDPPFTQMHLVACRNLLIYLRNPTQRKALSLFHFALKSNGILFLGPSETTGEVSDEFEPLDKHWRIYRKRRDVRLPFQMRSNFSGAATKIARLANPEPPTITQHKPDMLPAIYDVLLGQVMPPSVLIDSEFNIIHAFPGSTDYLTFPVGRPTSNILEVIYPAIRNSLAAAIQHATKDRKPVRYSGMSHPTDKTQQVRLSVRPIDVPSVSVTCCLIQFENLRLQEDQLIEAEIRDVDLSEAAATRIESLENELRFSRQNLQATIEELESSNEELQATNEEMVAANEELQSTNEELHSVNEELYTVNADHQKQMSELDQANSDMHNLLATTRVGVVFLDRDLLIRRFTPSVAKLLLMSPDDIGSSISEFAEGLQDKEIVTRLQQVLDTRREMEWELETEAGVCLVRALPYWTGTDIAGIVMAFIDINRLREAEAALDQFRFMADESIDAIVLVDSRGHVIYGNRAMAASLGYSVDELISLKVQDFDTQHGTADFDRVLATAEHAGGVIFESEHKRRDGKTFPVEVAVTYVMLQNKPHLFCTIRDIQERKRNERERLILQNAISAVENGIWICEADSVESPITFVNNGFTRMTGYESADVLGLNYRVLHGPHTDSEAAKTMAEAIESKETCRVLIQHYRKDGSPMWNDATITPMRDADGKVSHLVGVLNDVSERVRVAETARESERTIRLLLDSTAEGIFGVDAEGNCTFCNSSAARMLGYENEEEMIGRRIGDIVQPESVIESKMKAAIQNGESVNHQDEMFTRLNGEHFPVQFWCHPILADQRTIGAVITFVDDTERRERERELRITRDEARTANEAKSRFLANMSHELRTPLAAIMGFAKIIEEEFDDVELHEKLGTIQRNGDYLLRLLGDVLDLSRIESGFLKTNRQAVDLRELLSDLLHMMKMRTEENRATLSFKLENPLPQTITTDAARYRQILTNLIANAIKFSPNGTVLVTFRCEECSDSTAEMIARVQDDGIGISEEKLKQLFKPFTQADDSIAQRFGGTGLGLSISKRLIDALSGKISVESVEGEGSTFEVRIPVHPTGPMETVDLELEPSAASGTGSNEKDDSSLNARVLIADDMRDIRFIAQHFLQKAGCEVQVAENGELAVRATQRAIEDGKSFDLVLMDVQMPVLDGTEALKELRRAGVNVPVIALTADAMRGTRKRLMEMGFSEYLVKPLNVGKLLKIAKRLLASHNKPGVQQDS